MLAKSVPGYKWFEELWDTASGICFVRELINFTRPNGSSGGASKWGSVFFYWGNNYPRFAQVFSQIGRVYPNVPEVDKRQMVLF